MFLDMSCILSCFQFRKVGYILSSSVIAYCIYLATAAVCFAHYELTRCQNKVSVSFRHDNKLHVHPVFRTLMHLQRIRRSAAMKMLLRGIIILRDVPSAMTCC